MSLSLLKTPSTSFVKLRHHTHMRLGISSHRRIKLKKYNQESTFGGFLLQGVEQEGEFYLSIQI